jgi:hypothetical protein
MFYIDRVGNLIEYQDWFREAYPVSLARLDLYNNFSTETALDLGLRTPSDTDWAMNLGLRSLPYFSSDHHFTDSNFYDLPRLTPTQRQRFWGDLRLRNYANVPVALTYDSNALRGMGPDKDRHFLDEAYGFDGHAHLPGIDLDLQIPYLDFHDRMNAANDTSTRGFRFSATRSLSGGDADLQATFGRTRSYLQNLDRHATVDLYEFRGLVYEVGGIEGLRFESRATYRDTPEDLQLTSRTDSALAAKGVFSYTHPDGFSVQVGREHREVEQERLARAGLTLLGNGSTLRRADLAQHRLNDRPQTNDWFGRMFFRFQPWFSATYYQKETSMDGEPRTDLLGFNSPSLLFDRAQDKRANLQLQPLQNIGMSFRLWTKTSRNLARNYTESVRNRQGDLYWLLLNDRLNLGGSLAFMELTPSTLAVNPFQVDARSRTGSISYQLSTELSIFGDYTQVDNTGYLSSVERITNIGLEAETGGRHRVSWRVAYTVDTLANDQERVYDFNVRGLVISGDAQF